MSNATANTKNPQVLLVNSSGRVHDSVSRSLTGDVVRALEIRYGGIQVKSRDLADGVPFVDEAWIDANFTAPEARTDRQRETLAPSDRLVEELMDADIVVIGAPIYNFGVPAALKAWIDMITRAKQTFRYTESGSEGLLTGKTAYVVVASGGVAVGSAADFATPYLRHALQFIGIANVDIINADRVISRGEDALDDARVQIAERIHTAAQSPVRTGSYGQPGT